jgi:hypothetical protein
MTVLRRECSAIFSVSPMLVNDVFSSATLDFKLNVTTLTTSSQSLMIPLTVPSITLSGRQSKLIITSSSFGARSSIVYTTAQIFHSGVVGGRDIVFFYGDAAQAHEIALTLTGEANAKIVLPDTVTSEEVVVLPNTTIFSISEGTTGLVTLHDSETQLVLYADRDTATTFWAPIIADSSEGDPFREYWGLGTNQSVLVGGPYLVRTANVEGSTLNLLGDLNASIPLTVIVPNHISSITWNGRKISSSPATSISSQGAFRGSLALSDKVKGVNTTIPKLTGWRFKDSVPEIRDGFDDSEWVEANRTTTNSPSMFYGDGRILYGCDYGL